MCARASSPRTSPTTLPADLGVAVRVLGVPDRDGHSGSLLHRPVLGAVDLGVDEQLVVVGVDPHDVGADLAVGQLERDRAEVLAVVSEVADRRVEHGGEAMGRRPACETVRHAAAQRARRRADPVLDGPADRLLPHRVLREPRRRPRHARRVLPGHRGVPRVLGQPPATTCRRRCRSTGSPACGPATSGACAPPAGPRRSTPARPARSCSRHARVGARVRRPRRPQGPRRHP